MENIIKKREKVKGSAEKDWPKKFVESISCPLCNSKVFQKLYPEHYERIVRCKKCNLIYTNPRLKNKYLKHLYSEEYFNNSNSTHFGYENYIADQKKIIKTFSKRVESIEEFVKGGSLLDVGCAMGFFMKAAHDRKWRVEGVEISDFAAKYARSNYKFKVKTSDFLSFKSDKTYDLITFWDVVEHFYNPIQALKKANKMLKENGLLVLSTPDVDSIPAKFTRHRWVGYKLSDEHLTYFSKDTISKLLKKAGFKVVKKSHTGKHVSIPMLADRVSLYNSYAGRLVKSSGKILPANYFMYVNPLDIMCIYAKKS
jgi:2-polyprenyl-3-methyl-5-hydroxy-6-metoxy-1,4-benzoquinol methylase